MLRGHGIDIVDIERFREIVARRGDSFIERYFTMSEVEGSKKLADPVPYFAARFAAKEAFAKSMGTGFRGFGFSDIGIVRDNDAPPRLEFSERLRGLYPDISESGFSVSLSHEKKFAVASVIRF